MPLPPPHPMKHLLEVFLCIIVTAASLQLSTPGEVPVPSATEALTQNLHAVPGKLVWFLGCSIDSQAFVTACLNAKAAIMPDHMEAWAAIPDVKTKWCTFDGFTLVFSFHPGASPPPYYDYYVFQSTTPEIVRSEATLIAKTFGKPPDATVVDSSLWDVANWWKKDGAPQTWAVPHKEISHWSGVTVPAFLKLVQDVVPSSRIAFRSPPPVFKACIAGFYYMCRGPEITDEMYSNLMQSADNATHQIYGKYDLIDYRAIVLAEHKVLGGPLQALYGDTTHPGGHLAAAFIAAVLKWAKAA